MVSSLALAVVTASVFALSTAAAARPHKPSLDVMGPGTDTEIPLGKEPPQRPRSISGRAGSDAGKRGRR